MDTISEKILNLTGMLGTPGLKEPHFEYYGSATSGSSTLFELDNFKCPHISMKFMSDGRTGIDPDDKDEGLLLDNQQGRAFKAKLIELGIPFSESRPRSVRMIADDFMKATGITPKELNEEFEEKIFDESPAAGL